jgi:hypothetical protein
MSAACVGSQILKGRMGNYGHLAAQFEISSRQALETTYTFLGSFANDSMNLLQLSRKFKFQLAKLTLPAGDYFQQKSPQTFSKGNVKRSKRRDLKT